MIRAIIDTSVLVRYLIRPSSAVRRLIEDMWVGGQVHMITAPELVKDDKFVACAIVGQADCVITLDNDILALGALENIRMMTPDDFLDQMSPR